MFVTSDDFSVDRQVGHARINFEGTVASSDGVLAGGMFCTGRNAFDHDLLFGMREFLRDCLSGSKTTFLLANARLHAGDCETGIHVVIRKSADGVLVVTAFDASKECRASRMAEQKRREQLVFSQMSKGVAKTADNLRRALLEEIDRNPEKPQPAAIQKLWRFEGLAQEFAKRGKPVAAKGVIDLA